MMQRACYVTRRDRQINGNVMDARKIQAESQTSRRHVCCLNSYLLSNSYLLNCLQQF